jgi:DNA topoisomerase VI subunit B
MAKRKYDKYSKKEIADLRELASMSGLNLVEITTALNKKYNKKRNVEGNRQKLKQLEKKYGPYLAKPVKEVTSSQQKITDVINEIEKFLLQKNAQYGDSVLEPIRIFSTANIDEQVRVRIDDKLNRLLQGNSSLESDEDVIKDLIGYLVLLLVHMKY